MSDNIIPTYLSLEKKFLLKDRLKLIITNIGPGSYTALRVGVAFSSGLSLSQNIDLIGLNCFDIFCYGIKDFDLNSSAIFINSANDQKFIYLYNKLEGVHKIKKIDKSNVFQTEDISCIKKIYTNDKLSLDKIKMLNDIEGKELCFNQLVSFNIKKIILLPKSDIIRPIYISNNEFLN